MIFWKPLKYVYIPNITWLTIKHPTGIAWSCWRHEWHVEVQPRQSRRRNGPTSGSGPQRTWRQDPQVSRSLEGWVTRTTKSQCEKLYEYTLEPRLTKKGCMKDSCKYTKHIKKKLSRESKAYVIKQHPRSEKTHQVEAVLEFDHDSIL